VCLIYIHDSIHKSEIFNSKCDLCLLLFCKSGYLIILFSSNILFLSGRLAYIYSVTIYTKQLVQEWLTSLGSELFLYKSRLDYNSSQPNYIHYHQWHLKFIGNLFPHLIRGGVRSTRGLGLTVAAWGQSIGISIAMLTQTLIMSRLDQLPRLGARI